MNLDLPTATIHPRPADWSPDGDPLAWPWHELAPLPALILADGSAPALRQTTVRLCSTASHLFVHFVAEDDDIWGTFTARDAALYDEEVVELFIAPGADTPTFYYEFEVSPLGALLDLTVSSPTGSRQEMTADFAWDCPGLIWSARRFDAEGYWTAFLGIPWTALGAAPDDLPRVWRANFYRIERPRLAAPEFSCWSPTLTDPADFHRPARFGHLYLPDIPAL